MRKFIKENIKFIIVIFICIIGSGLSTYATEYLFNSNEVQYDNSTSGIRSSNVQDAIDELYGHATDYNEIKTAIGNSTLATTSQTLTGAINELNDKTTFKLIWTNPNPNSAFGDQTIVFDDNYSLYYIETRTDDYQSYKINSIFIAGDRGILVTLGGSSTELTGGLFVMYRYFETTSNSIHFHQTGQTNYNDFYRIDNNRLVPTHIYGAK